MIDCVRILRHFTNSTRVESNLHSRRSHNQRPIGPSTSIFFFIITLNQPCPRAKRNANGGSARCLPTGFSTSSLANFYITRALKFDCTRGRACIHIFFASFCSCFSNFFFSHHISFFERQYESEKIFTDNVIVACCFLFRLWKKTRSGTKYFYLFLFCRTVCAVGLHIFCA